MDDRTSDAGTVLDRERRGSPDAGMDRVAPGELESPARHIAIALRDINKSYTSANGEVAEVLKGLNLEIEAGSFNVIRGESGSGKTSLLRILGMLDSKFDGDYLFAGDDI